MLSPSTGRVRDSRFAILTAFALVGTLILSACGGAAAPTAAPKAEPAKSSAPPTTQATGANAAKPEAAAKASSPSRDQILAGAEKEGEVVFYTAMNIGQARPLADAFRKKYPFIKKADILRLDGQELVAKMLTEARSGHQIADVTSLTDVEAVKSEGLLEAYVSPEGSVYPADMKDPLGFWNAVNLNASVILFNTNLVKKEEAPKTYQDLLDPKWKGQISLEVGDWDWMISIEKMMGDQGKEYMKKLAAQDIQLRKGHGSLVQLVGAGETKLAACSLINTVIPEMEKGAPIDYVRTPAVWAEAHGIALIKNAPHPNAARLFIDFALSEEGQKILASQGRIVGRPGVAGSLSEIMPAVKIQVLDPKETLSQDKYQKEFDSYFVR